MQLYLKNWYDSFLKELPKTKDLKIISPFVKEQILRKIGEKFDLKNLELISRFNLRDFASGVSSLEGLKFIVTKEANVFGIRDLHSKVYLFDKRAAIITSANLTSGGLINNFECGIYINEPKIISELHDYFDNLRNLAGKPLEFQQCEEWQQKIDIEIPNTDLQSLPDYGAKQIQINTSINYYVKFFGTGKDRVPMTFPVREEVEEALCHYACTFSKKPDQVNDGDVIYMARMTTNSTDYAIFGKAIAIKHIPGRDIATQQEIQERVWKVTWPVYLRVANPVFVDGLMSDCVLLYDLMKAMDYMSFPSTKKRYFEDGERDINPKRSLQQKAYIPLTPEAVEWLEPRFQATLNIKGKVPSSFISNLPISSY